MSQIGRKNLYADIKEVTPDNILDILSAVASDFQSNREDCDRLLVIESGKMPMCRVKVIRPEIDVKTVDPIAHQISSFKQSFHWGEPITLVQRGQKDSGSTNENVAIALMNECYAAENIGRKQKRLGYFVENTGIGYTFVNIKSDWVEGDSYFEIEALDPRYAFVVRSTMYSDHRVILGVSFRIDQEGNKYYTAFSRNYRFEITNSKITSVIDNPLHMIPIIEWERSDDRMGVFEREIPEMDRLNLLLADISNGVESAVQTLWQCCDVEFPRVKKKDENGNEVETDEIQRPVAGEWILTQSTKDGKQPFIKPLVMDYDYSGLLNNYTTSRAMILERTCTPQRNDNSGGSTASATDLASGWSAAEQEANAQQLLMEASKLEEVKVALAVIGVSDPRVPLDSPLRTLRYVDCKPNITRQKTYEMSVKSAALSAMLSHGIYGLHALEAVNLFSDVTQVWEDSKELIEKYQNKTFGDDPDKYKSSDLPNYQLTNSPLIDGMSLEKPNEETE